MTINKKFLSLIKGSIPRGKKDEYTFLCKDEVVFDVEEIELNNVVFQNAGIWCAEKPIFGSEKKYPIATINEILDNIQRNIQMNKNRFVGKESQKLELEFNFLKNKQYNIYSHNGKYYMEDHVDNKTNVEIAQELYGSETIYTYDFYIKNLPSNLLDKMTASICSVLISELENENIHPINENAKKQIKLYKEEDTKRKDNTRTINFSHGEKFSEKYFKNMSYDNRNQIIEKIKYFAEQIVSTKNDEFLIEVVPAYVDGNIFGFPKFLLSSGNQKHYYRDFPVVEPVYEYTEEIRNFNIKNIFIETYKNLKYIDILADPDLIHDLGLILICAEKNNLYGKRDNDLDKFNQGFIECENYENLFDCLVNLRIKNEKINKLMEIEHKYVNKQVMS